MLFSVVVCTYNRETLLKRAIDSLLLQSIDVCEFEIIIIDNRSTDNTKELVSDYVNKYSNVSYFYEEKLGLSHARNRGLFESKGVFIVYTDDDCDMPVNWLKEAKRILQMKEIDIMGGPIDPFYLSRKSLWYKDEYAILSHGTSNRFLHSNEYLFGGNLFVKRTLFDQYGIFDPNFGMTGNVIGYSEETELQIRMTSKNAGIKIYYDPLLVVAHVVRPEKLYILWWVRSFIAKGRSNFILDSKGHPELKTYRISVLFKLILSIFKITVHLFVAYSFRNRKRFPLAPNYIYEKMHGHFKQLGYSLEAFKKANHSI